MNTNDIQTQSTKTTVFQKLVAAYLAPYEAITRSGASVDASARLRFIPVV